MNYEVLKRIKQEGRLFCLERPEAALEDAQSEAWRRWPDPASNLYRALFLTGWTLAASENLRLRPADG